MAKRRVPGMSIPRFWIWTIPLALLAGTLVLTVGCTLSGQAGTEAETARLVERGRYLVSITGCNDCHTPWIMGPAGPEPDMTRMLSGHPQDLVMMPAHPPGPEPWAWVGAASNTAFSGPWGTSYAFNLTPDEMTGTGIWTEEIFINTIRNGRHWGVSRPILPPMPWQVYRQMTDEDLRSVFAYLRTIPPIRNKVPDAILAEELTSQ